MGGILLWLAVAWQAPPAVDPLQAILARVAEEAEVFESAAANLTAEEAFQQRARKAARRFRPRFGAAAAQIPKPEYQTREIVSEYGYSVLREARGQIHEFRQVVSVDGRRVANRDEARETLVKGLLSGDDRVKKRMLEKFKRHGLTQAATDFGQIILLFGRRQLGDYSFSLARSERIGADPVQVLGFKQTGGGGSLLIFQGRTAIHQPLEGEIWVRQPDGLPLRITLKSARQAEQVWIRDEATVDYVMSQHGVLVPASVVHRQHAGKELVVENLFRYSTFHKFAVQAEVKFN